jgi:hypothetical protein
MSKWMSDLGCYSGEKNSFFAIFRENTSIYFADGDTSTHFIPT